MSGRLRSTRTPRPGSSASTQGAPHTTSRAAVRRGGGNKTPSSRKNQPSTEPKSRTRARQASVEDTDGEDVAPQLDDPEEEDLADLPSARGRAQVKKRNRNTDSSAAAKAQVDKDGQGKGETQSAITVDDVDPAKDDELQETLTEYGDAAEQLATEAEQEGRPSLALSGTTFRTSLSGNQISNANTIGMIENLWQLWDSSYRLIRILSPANLNTEVLNRLHKDLADPKSLDSRNRQRYLSDYQDAKEHFSSAQYIDVQVAQLELVKPSGTQSLDDLPKDSLRADELMYMGNLAYVINSIPTDGTLLDNSDLDVLNRRFPVFAMPGFGSGIGESQLLDQTFKIAVGLRVQLLKSIIAAQHGQPEFTAEAALMEVFYSSRELKGWGVAQMDPANWDESYEAYLNGQIEKIQEILEGYNEDQDITGLQEALDKQFSPAQFQCDFLAWIRSRADELKKCFSDRQEGDVDDLQRSLSQFNSRPQQEDHTEGKTAEQVRVDEIDDTPTSQRRRSALASPQASAMPSPQRRKQTNFNSRNGIRILRSRASAATAALESLNAPEQPAAQSDPTDTVAPREQLAQNIPAETNTDTGTTAAPEDPPASRDENEPRPANDPKILAQIVAAGWPSKSRASVPQKPSLMDRQPGAQRVAIDTPESSPSRPPAKTANGVMVPNSQGSNDEEEESPAFQVDRRVVPQRTKTRGKRGRSTIDDAAAADQVIASPKKRRRLRSKQSVDPGPSSAPVQTQDESQAQAEATQPADQNSGGDVPQGQAAEPSGQEQAPRIKTRQGAPGIQREYRVHRKAWSEDEDRVLLGGLNKFYKDWNKFILVKNGDWDMDGVLRSRTNVDCKDRARNLKVQHLRDGMALPRGLRDIALKRADEEKLSRMGISVQ